MSYGRTLDIKNFKENLRTGDKKLDKEYNDIFQSFAKRVDYSIAYFYAYEEFASPEAIKDDWETDFSGKNGTNHRLYYEAQALAFLQNIHALCDTVPYAINKILVRNDKIKEPKWNEDFIKAVEAKFSTEPIFVDTLRKFMQNDDFLRLKAYVNRAKHQHLVIIKNNRTELYFDDFVYYLYPAPNKKVEAIAKGEKVEEFMLRVHKNLVGELMHIYNYMYQLA